MIDKGDIITDVERFELEGRRYIAIQYKHLGKSSGPMPGAIFGLFDRRCEAEKIANEQGITNELKVPTKETHYKVTYKEEFESESQTFILIKYEYGEKEYAAVFETFEMKMKEIARQYLALFGVEITTIAKEVITYGAIDTLIRRNRGKDWEPFMLGDGENYIAELYEQPQRCGEIHFKRNDDKVPDTISLAEAAFRFHGEQPPAYNGDSYELIEKLITVLRKRKG